MDLKEGSVRQLGLVVQEAREALIFLGAGSSAEGYQDEGRFPDFGTLVHRVLDDEGIDAADDEMAAFLKIMRRWEEESTLSVRLSGYLHGSPGIAHYQMASMTMSLFPNVNMTVYLTTNYDDLMLKALVAVAKADPKRDPKLFSLARNSAVREISRTFDAIRGHAIKGVPVIVKLFGDLTANNPIFEPEDMPFDEWTEQRLSVLFDRPVLFIGCSLRDAPVLRLLVQSRSSHPVFVVSPSAPERTLLPRLAQRHFFWIPKSFSAFVSDFIDIRRATDIGFDAQFAQFLCVADAALLTSSKQAVRDLAAIASAAASARFQNRSGFSKPDSRAFSPIARTETGPDFERFERSPSRILAIIGESGSGKSTLLHSRYASTSEGGENIFLYYDAQSFQGGRSVADTLAVDLMVDRPRLRDTLRTLSGRLAEQKANLIVMIDAINENAGLGPEAIRHEIDALTLETPGNVKFIYTCRRVIWENRVVAGGDLPRDLYFDHKPFMLGRFSSKEAAEAFKAHRAAFHLKSTYDRLSPAVKEHIRDPLMLRLISEAYSGLGLPTFAPAALVFQRVLDRLRSNYRRTPLIDYLERLVETRLTALESGDTAGDIFTYLEARTEPALVLLAQQQLGADRHAEHPLTILEDENIIAPLDQCERQFKFTYERFFEFLLGLRLQYRLFTQASMPLDKALQPLLELCRNAHYSLYQALCSAVVTEYLAASEGPQRRLIGNLIFHPEPDISHFARDVLREVVFDSEEDALVMLSELTGTERGGLAILLDIGYEAEAIAPFAVDALFECDITIRRQGVACLIGHANAFNSLGRIRELFWRRRRETKDAKANATALVYFAAVLLGTASDVGKGIADAISLLSATCGEPPSDATVRSLANALAHALAEEGPMFFGANYRPEGVLAAWVERSGPIIAQSQVMIDLLRDPSAAALGRNLDTLVSFATIEAHARTDGPELIARQIDYRVAQWLLIRIWLSDSETVLELLDTLVASGRPFDADFALGIVEQALIECRAPSSDLVEASLEKMRAWTDQFEAKDEFYLALSTADPFGFNLAPLAMFANVQAHFAERSGDSIPILIEWLADPDGKRRRMALLTANWLARTFPEKVLNSLEAFLDEADVAPWIDRVLAGVAAHSPRLLNEFLERARVPIRRREAIRRLLPPARYAPVQFRPDSALAWLFLGPQERLDRVADVYELMYATDSAESYFLALLERATTVRVPVEQSEDMPLLDEGV